MKTKNTFIVIGLVIVIVLTITTSAKAGTWTQKADMPTARNWLSTSVVDGKVYAIGGLTVYGGTDLATVEVYNPVTDTWTQKADMPTPRGGLATSVVDGKIYAIGGGSDDNRVEEYDPVTDTWTEKADLPTPRGSLATSVVNGKIYAIGGGPSKAMVATVEEYDPATDTWTKKADMPTARKYLSSCVVNGKIYAFGGQSPKVFPAFSTVEEYDPVTDTWTKKTNMPAPRTAPSTSVVGDKIYVFGGAARRGGVPVYTLFQYDTATDTWTVEDNMPGPMAGMSSSAIGGKIYIIGGTSVPYPYNPSLSTVWEYDTGFAVASPDFNGDGAVDIKDLLKIIESWSQNDPTVDIAPLPFGDGIVDALDLEILMSYWGQKTEDVRAHWALDEIEGVVAHDSIGNYEGTLHGEPLWQPEGGKFSGALEFDGIDDYISTPFVLNPAKGSLSVFAWIKGGAPGQVIISQRDNTDGLKTNPGSAWLLADSSDGRLITRLMHPPFDPLVSEFVITDGQWHHIGLVYDFDGLKRYLYVDGAEVAKDTDFAGGIGSDGGLHLGAGKYLDPASFFSGLIDDVRIYNRVVKP